MLAKKEQLQASAVKMELGLSGLNLDMHAIMNIKSNSKNKRRFGDEQIKSLEVMFESDSRPESVIKQQLANELGLQPRQIAIWFQNRRARSKAKQIERDYNVLKESYESMKRENQSLRIQLQKLKSQLEMEHGNRHYGPNGTNDNGLNGGAIFDTNDKATILFDSCDDNNGNGERRVEDSMVLGMI